MSRAACTLIEFAGPSCAGKSTLIRGLEQDLGARGVPARAIAARKRRRRTDILRALAEPRIALWCALNPRQVLGRWTVRSFLGTIGAIRRLRRLDGVFLIDEGPVKLFPDLPMQTRAASLLLRGLPVPDVLVVVSCEPRIRLERMRRAGRPHIRRLSDEEVFAEPTGDALARHFAEVRQVPAIEVDTSPGRPAPDLSARLVPLLNREPRGDP